MAGKKTFFTILIVGIISSSFLVSGCAKKDELNLPELETKQLAGAGETNKPSAAPVKGARIPGEFKKFFVYADGAYFKNHYIPSGWMGDVGDLAFSDNYTTNPQSRRSCIRITYSALRKQGAGWAGVYWQDPANNWGNAKGGFDLTGAKKVTFWARGENGGEVVTEFKVGGITGEFSDSASVSIGPVVLTKEWKEYTIDVSKEDLSLIIGGFVFVMSAMENPQGAIFYLDEIAYE